MTIKGFPPAGEWSVSVSIISARAVATAQVIATRSPPKIWLNVKPVMAPIRHDKLASVGGDCGRHGLRPGEILANLVRDARAAALPG